ACGGAALFGVPLLLTAIVLGAGPTGAPATSTEPTSAASPSDAPNTDAVLGELMFHAFGLGFEPASVEVEEPGRYTVTFMNDGAVLHDITFADGTVLEAGP